VKTHPDRWVFVWAVGLALKTGGVAAATLGVPGNFATISEALAIAQLGDTVLVQEDVYVEGFTIPEGVTVLAAGDREQTWIVPGTNDNRIIFGEGTIAAVLEGFSIWTDTEQVGATDILVRNPAGVLRGNDLHDAYVYGEYGFAVKLPVGGIVEHNRFLGGTFEGIWIAGGSPIVRYNAFFPACYPSPFTAIMVEEADWMGAEPVGTVEVRNNTFGSPNAVVVLAGSEGPYVDLVNNIFYECAMGCASPGEQILNVHHNLFYYSGIYDCEDENVVMGPGNIWNEDPLFCDPWGECDLHVDAASPAVGAGENGETIGAYGIGCGIVSAPPQGPGLDLVGRPSPNPSRASVSVPAPGWEHMDVFDPGGRLVRRLSNPLFLGTAVWDGMDENEHPVATGTYLLKVTSGGRAYTRQVTIIR
jgi:hypothetical protein